MVAHLELLLVLIEDLLRSPGTHITSRTEHVNGKILNVHTADFGQILCCHPVDGSTGRRTEHERIGDNRCHEKSGDLLGNLHAIFLIHLIDDRRRTAYRLIAEVDRFQCLQSTDPVMVNDLQNLCKCNAVYGLACLIMIHKDQSSLSQIQEIPAGNHTDIISIQIQNREITISFLTHDALDIFCLLCHLECNQSLSLHEMGDRHTLVNHTRYGKCIMRRHNNTAVMFLCQLLNRLGHFRTHTHNNACCIHLNGTQLGFIAVTQDDHVTLMDIVLHHIRVGCRDDYLSLIINCVDISQQEFCIQRLQNVLIRGACHGQNAVVIDVHVRIGNITDGDQSLQSLVIRNGQGDHSQCPHHIPCFLQGNVTCHSLRLANLNVTYICHNVRHIDRSLRLKIVQYILRLLVDLSGSCCTIPSSMQQIFQFCISYRRTDGISIRVLMSDDIYR